MNIQFCFKLFFFYSNNIYNIQMEINRTKLKEQKAQKSRNCVPMCKDQIEIETAAYLSIG